MWWSTGATRGVASAGVDPARRGAWASRRACRAKLDKLERKIELLTRDDGAQGEWTDFEADTPSPVRNAPPSEELPF